MSHLAPSNTHIALIGLGEVGSIFAKALLAQGAIVTAYDRLIDSEQANALHQHAKELGVQLHTTLAQALNNAHIVISAVTASQTQVVAQAAAPHVPQGAFYLDVNSASPNVKQHCASCINTAGGRYIEVAVMTSVPPYGIKVPMLLGGPHAAAAHPILTALGFAAHNQNADYGVVSAVKMCRSVIIKGLESLVIESFTAAAHYGVADQVLASLDETFPNMNWEKQGDYFFSRVIMHGQRRSEEMFESAKTVKDTGLAGHMPYATAQMQASIAAFRKQGVFEDPYTLKPWRQRAATLLQASNANKNTSNNQ